MKVSELINHLKKFDGNLPVMVRIEDPCGGPDYWTLTEKDILLGDVLMDEGEGREIPAVLIGDDRV